MQNKKGAKYAKIKKISIVGVIPSFAFQRAKHCALALHRNLPQRFPLPEIVGLLELDWNEKLEEWKQALGKQYWCLRRPVAVFFDDRFIGNDIELIKLISIKNIVMDSIPCKSSFLLKESFRKDYITHLKKTKGIYCYLDICVDDEYVGTLIFELHSHLLPRTCENFKTLCLGSRGPLFSYRGSRIHRIVKQGWLQGGDIQFKTGGGGFSIFCDPLEDECFGISHDKRGILSMASGGRHRNGSQFFITLKPSKWMDTHFVAFGQLIEGAKVLNTLENLETFYECPLKKVEIKSCGKLDLGDVEDVDARYKEEAFPEKKPKKIETICEQIVRLIMEALTDALARKEHKPDVLDDGDIPSKMNLQLYFQGFYSLPEKILEETAAYLRNLRRQLLRVMKPSATEIVEVIMYDLLMAALTRMTTLDDIRETIGYNFYQKMVSKINMELEMCQKSCVKRLIDQIVSTAEKMVDLISKKILRMKRKSKDLQKFQDRMQNWVQSFVLQEKFKGDSYFIAERPYNPEKPKEEEKEYPKREGKPCCEIEKKKKQEELLAKLRAKYAPEDLCCLGSKLHLSDSIINLSDYFSKCRYDLKKVPKMERYRMPLLDLIEIGRFKLQVMRKQEDRVKDEERLRTDKKIRKWMLEVAYIPETSWLKEAVFPKDCRVLDHMEEIMYGAMTVGLLEMYYFMEEYLKVCKTKKQMLVTRTIYPEDGSFRESQTSKSEGSIIERKLQEGENENEEEEEEEEIQEPPKEESLPPCTCGHPCCVCKFDPKFKAPPPSEEGEQEMEEEEEEGEGERDLPVTVKAEPPSTAKICASDETLVDLNFNIAERVSMSPEEVDIRSFKWLKSYIIEEGCDLKTEFATQVHKWFEGEQFSLKGFISKHSLVTRASLLSLSVSLAKLIMDQNNLKGEIKNFIYDLWDLYFEEMFKEAVLEFPPEQPAAEEDIKEEEGEEEVEEESELDDDQVLETTCKKILFASDTNYDFDKYCGKHDGKTETETEAETETETAVQNEDSERFENLVEVQREISKEEAKQTDESADKVKQDTGHSEPQASQISPPPTTTQASQEDMYQVPKEEEIKHKESEEDINVEEKIPDEGGGGDFDMAEKPPKKRRSPYVIQEYVDLPSSEESRDIPPYVLPFWVKFLTELTKQALGALAKVSRLPRRLYYTTDSEIAFDDKMKEWFQFNAFNPQPTKGREIMDFIALHHRSLTDLEDSARSYLKKKKYSELLNRCTRFASADVMAEEIVSNVVDSAMKNLKDNEAVELFVSNLVSSAVTSSPSRSQTSADEEEMSGYMTMDTDQRESQTSEQEDD